MDRATLEILFANGPMIRQTLEKDPSGTKMLGRGLFEKDLESQGFTKSELRKLVDQEILARTTVRYQGGWRNTYVLLPSKEVQI